VVDSFQAQPFIGCLTVRYLVQKIFRRRVSASSRKRQKFRDQECRPFKGCQLRTAPIAEGRIDTGRAAHGQTAHGRYPDAVFLGVPGMNPAREVKTERFSRTEGKTPAFVEGEVQTLLAAIEASTHIGLRDRALQALAIWENALDPEHPDVATCLANLAELYHAQGR
jgi:hypothetical protein